VIIRPMADAVSPSASQAATPARDGVPAVVDVFSSSARAWFVALVVSEAGGAFTVRFLDAGGTSWEKSVFREDPRLAAFGAHTDGMPPPGFEAVPSRSRPGQAAYLDAAGRQKYGTLELAWQAYLEQRALGSAACERSPGAYDAHKAAISVHSVSSVGSVGTAAFSPPRSMILPNTGAPLLERTPESRPSSCSAHGRPAVCTTPGASEAVHAPRGPLEDWQFPPGRWYTACDDLPRTVVPDVQTLARGSVVSPEVPWWADQSLLPPPNKHLPGC